MNHSRQDIPGPGDICQPEARRVGVYDAHAIEDPSVDHDLQVVYRWLRSLPITDLLSAAVDDAVKYVLDGPRTWRFDLMSPEVDSDERASVGTKLQYHVINRLGLIKEPPLDTSILGIAVEIKGTVGRTWMIPREGQCEVTLLFRINARRHTFEVWLMRTHRAWLTGGNGNRDLKRSPIAGAVRRYALIVVPETPLPPEPLRQLTPEHLDVVFGPAGLRRRLVALFEALPEVVIPRGSIAVVGAGLGDPMKRAREAKSDLRRRGLIVLVGTWPVERRLAAELGFDISGEAWVAVREESFAFYGLKVPSPR
ncbi:NaeI family type II restriction endonuclease [Plantibacter sp. CFBP 8804]|uniref:NaeI family type II restriction endonuclease n=1 Tax=Plantibacter sp. CFBP 8804 TaxID=2775270 RepID=UPI0017803CCF|nr:NaeI family type II restriction endonuclease [Plantibacter sp. CFBP 8804]MBD8518783.1 hypothetical protein [Plantibacter sp. CFBP 8804]